MSDEPKRPDLEAQRVGFYKTVLENPSLLRPVPDTPPSMRERLARVTCFADECCFSRDEPCKSPDECDTHEVYLQVVDAILTELQEPSEGMIEAACPDTLYDNVGRQGEDVCKFTAGWRWAIQHIKDGGQ